MARAADRRCPACGHEVRMYWNGRKRFARVWWACDNKHCDQPPGQISMSVPDALVDLRATAKGERRDHRS